MYKTHLYIEFWVLEMGSAILPASTYGSVISFRLWLSLSTEFPLSEVAWSYCRDSVGSASSCEGTESCSEWWVCHWGRRDCTLLITWLICHLYINSMGQGPAWKTDTYLVNKFWNLLSNRMFHSRIYVILSLGPTRNHMNTVHTITLSYLSQPF
jgi:hypothetical protein